MQPHILCVSFFLLLLASPFASQPQQYGYHNFGQRQASNAGGFLRTLGVAVGTGLLVKGAILAKSAFFNYGKKKRSADGLYEEDDEIDRLEEALRYFDLAMELDEDTCVEKTLCEIMATSEAEKNPIEIVKILDTIYSGKLPLMGQPEHEEATSLLKAGYLGKINKSKHFCDNTFKLCHKDSAVRQKYLKEEYELVKKLD